MVIKRLGVGAGRRRMMVEIKQLTREPLCCGYVSNCAKGQGPFKNTLTHSLTLCFAIFFKKLAELVQPKEEMDVWKSMSISKCV